MRDEAVGVRHGRFQAGSTPDLSARSGHRDKDRQAASLWVELARAGIADSVIVRIVPGNRE